ncbi:hypothetical protein PSAKL28_25770 [Pseudomonas alkylphenolica]|uniref:Uncharacterized protein n=2 Tax=Pseudomonas alkylphenolica TaxID=237609 RepID=A0A077FD45_9PSED|nr:hypothetical protein PSAKL28_25770 [Pseudomonas alkylphenolica]
MADKFVLSVVWGETQNVTPKDGAPATVKRLHAVVANLAAQAKKRGLGGQLQVRPAPRVDTELSATFETMRTTVDEVESGVHVGNSLPARAALVEIPQASTARLDFAFPRTLSWIFGTDVRSGGDFFVGDASNKRLYRLFESNEPPTEDQLPFVSQVTGSGLSAPVPPNPYKKLAWVVGIFAAVIFFIGAAVSISTGHSVREAKNLLMATNPALQYRLFESVRLTCEEDANAFPSAKHPTVCDNLLANEKASDVAPRTKKLLWDPSKVDAVLKGFNECHEGNNPRECDVIRRGAAALERKTSSANNVLGVARAASVDTKQTEISTSSTSILSSFLMLAVGIAGLIIALGLGTKQRVAGVWIDVRNRVSLARAQVTLWTVVALSGYAALALFNIGFTGVGSGWEASVFPTIPTSVAAALGIATASPMISALILPTKDPAQKQVNFVADPDPRKRGIPFLGAQSDGLSLNDTPQMASITDMFMGEEIANANTVDVSRLQNVLITVLLVLGYFAVMLQVTGDISALSLYGTNGPRFLSLPDLGASFTSLLFVSHATYLVAKAHDARAPNSAEPASE